MAAKITSAELDDMLHDIGESSSFADADGKRANIGAPKGWRLGSILDRLDGLRPQTKTVYTAAGRAVDVSARHDGVVWHAVVRLAGVLEAEGVGKTRTDAARNALTALRHMHRITASRQLAEKGIID